MRRLVWLASYPKSGNTWLRLLLASYERPDGAAGFDALDDIPTAAGRATLDDLAGVESSDLLAAEIDLLRPRVYERMAAETTRRRAFKVHDAYFMNDAGEPCFPPSASAGVVYAIRNPLDVAVSFAHHMGYPLSDAVDIVCDERAALGGSRRRGTHMLRERLLSWSAHVRSWVEAPQLRRHVVRYEDLCRDPAAELRAIVTFLGHETDDARLRRAVEDTTFDSLQAREAAEGFHEVQPRSTAPFFRRGRPGGWRGALTSEQVRRIIDTQGETMRRFGYLTDDDEPLH